MKNALPSPGDLALLPYLDDMLDALSDGLSVCDDKGHYLRVNAKYLQITGLSREEIIGKTIGDLKKAKYYDVILYWKVLETRKPGSVIQTTLPGRQLVTTGIPILDENGSVRFVLTFVRDVTSLEELKEQIAEQQNIIARYQQDKTREEGVLQGLFVGQSKSGNRLKAFLYKVAPFDATVFLHGETGVGKSVLAKALHQDSPRRKGPFIKIDCGAIPEHLVESELFGYAPGAFSGASDKGKAGMLELADKGTLLLDEIAELPLHMQSRLLRFLQDREIVRLGSTDVRKVDARIIAATNKNLEAEVQAGRFREDLYYRLCVVECRIPPLRERWEDIIPFAQHFLEKWSKCYRKRLTITPEVCARFVTYSWPGNIRELEHLMESLVITSEPPSIHLSALPERFHAASPPSSPDMDASGKTLKAIISGMERELLRKAMEQGQTADDICQRYAISRSSLFRKLKG